MRMIVAFEKTDRVRHIGHLDLLRAMQRALRRSGLPVRYSQGFNPHVVLSFASPLSVGIGGTEELMDVGLAEDVSEAAFARALTPALPEALPLVRVRAVEDRHPALMAMLQSGMYQARLALDDAARAMMAAIPALLAEEALVVQRRTKSGTKPCDIRPMILALSAREADAEAVFDLHVSMTERATLKPSLLMETLADRAGVTLPTLLLRRTGLLGAVDGEAVPLMTC